MSKKKILGGAGITAGGDVTFGDVSGQVAITQSIGQTDAQEDSLWVIKLCRRLIFSFPHQAMWVKNAGSLQR